LGGRREEAFERPFQGFVKAFQSPSKAFEGPLKGLLKALSRSLISLKGLLQTF
jgi:hypothetical protein